MKQTVQSKDMLEGGVRRPKKGRLIFSLFVLILLLVVILYMTLCGIWGFETGEMPNLFGYSTYISTSSYQNAPSGAAVIVQRDVDYVGVGEDIAVYLPEENSSNQIRILKVVSVADDSSYIVRSADGQPEQTIFKEQIRGKALGYIPVLGVLLAVAQTTLGLVLFIAMLLLDVILIFITIHSYKKAKRQFAAGSAAYLGEWEETEDDGEEIESVPFTANHEEGEEPQQSIDQIEEEELEQPVEEPQQNIADQEELAPFDLRVEATPKKADPPKKTRPAIQSNIWEDLVSIELVGETDEIERIAKIIDLVIQRKQAQDVIFDIIYGEKTKILIQCPWKDVNLVATIMTSLHQKYAQNNG